MSSVNNKKYYTVVIVGHLFYCAFIGYYRPRVLPESPRWLLSRNRTDQAWVIIKRVAKTNKVNLNEKMKKVTLEEGQDEGIIKIIRNLFTSRQLVIRLFIVGFNW